MLRGLRARFQLCLGLLRDRDFWLVFLWVLLTIALVGGMGWLAIGKYDAFLRLRPIVCSADMNEMRFLLVATLSPLCALFTVLTIGELMAMLEQRRHDGSVPMRYFSLFTILMLVSAVAVLMALRC